MTEAALSRCKQTDNGLRVRTTCLFSSFEPVFVYVVRFGDGFVVHDAGETMAVILTHGQDGATARRIMLDECRRYGVTCEGRRLSAKVDSADWLESAIIAVANTAAAAARVALVDRTRKSERALADTLFVLLQPQLPRGALMKEYAYQGASGRRYRFDLAVQGPEGLSLIEVVRPNPNSVNAKYVALSDVGSSDAVQRIAAHSGDLAREDVLLLQNVATVATSDGVLSLLGSRAAAH
ncbi:MAG: hypothetical protein H3C51_07800 [Rubellimicrobium sp.]|nr:hypothetical protein [Rubellimicrobium sp.]